MSVPAYVWCFEVLWSPRPADCLFKPRLCGVCDTRTGQYPHAGAAARSCCKARGYDQCSLLQTSNCRLPVAKTDHVHFKGENAVITRLSLHTMQQNNSGERKGRLALSSYATQGMCSALITSVSLLTAHSIRTRKRIQECDGIHAVRPK